MVYRRVFCTYRKAQAQKLAIKKARILPPKNNRKAGFQPVTNKKKPAFIVKSFPVIW
jgi:hypothetical protein